MNVPAPVLVVYATREGQARRIAEHVAATLRARGRAAEVHDAAGAAPAPAGFSAAVLIGSVHVGSHERELIDYVRRHRAALAALPTAFLSVSLSEAGAEDAHADPAHRAAAAADAAGMIERFLDQTGWQPGRVMPVAGALAYTRYGLLVRLVMRFIAKRSGGSTDTARDHEYTDWEALDRFADAFVQEVARG